jgi:hypothetical protein
MNWFITHMVKQPIRSSDHSNSGPPKQVSKQVFYINYFYKPFIEKDFSPSGPLTVDQLLLADASIT